MSWLFISGAQRIVALASASVLPMNIQSSHRELLNALRWPKWEGSLKKSTYIHIDICIYVCMYITDSLCYIAESNTTLESNCMPIKFF